MSVIILGGNECMTRQYIELCGEYNCKAKVFPKMSNSIKNIGSPDLLILFTSTVSHTMVRRAMRVIDRDNTIIERSHSSSIASLKSILDSYASREEMKNV